ncbi:MAG: hypothetical protein JWQ35_1271 [Bacteriovoracaceae bacterium]|nr:hypothetical protein [Bacteriovoracaceae bacterium]
MISQKSYSVSSEELFQFQGPNHSKLSARHWRNENARGTLIGVHGYSEHSGCYSHFADFLLSKGLDIVWIDLPGHGLSEGKRSDIDDFEDYIRSLELCIDEASKRGCRGPFFLFGHSLGGLISIRFLETSRKAALFNRLVLSSPFLGISGYSRTRLYLLKLLTAALPNFTLPAEGNLTGSSLTHDEKIIARRAADPLIKSCVTIHFLREFLKARNFAFEQSKNIKIPIAIFQAGDDKITQRSEAEIFYSQLEGSKELKIYEGFYHEILNEINRALVMDDMWKWIEPGLK